jgi:hypothetical protein
MRQRYAGVFEAMSHILVMADRERVGHEASPSAAVIDRKTLQDDGERRRAGTSRIWSTP